jgi:rare lipoprotein A
MRTYLYAVLTAVTFGLLTLTPASAERSHWSCIGPAVACADTGSSKWSAYDTRSSSRKYASRSERRYGSRAKSRRQARRYDRRDMPQRKPTRVASADRRSSYRSSYSGGSAHSGMASYYGSESGSRTASGARFNPSGMTAAHRSLPFGTKVRVTNKRNGRSVVVTINDRGPFVRGRIIDLSSGAAGVIGMRGAGVAPVSVEVLGRS